LSPPFVTVEELGRLLDEEPHGLVLADVRWSLDGSEGRRTYRQGHLPGAVYVDLDLDLSAPASLRDGRHPLPSPVRFAAALGARGIGHEDRVVAYDQAGGTIAARLVWMLRAIGQEAAVLSGGLAAWPGALVPGEVSRPLVARAAVPWPADRVADADDVAALARVEETVVLDARDAARFRGEHEPVDARAGHVPGARSLPTVDLVDDEGRLLDAEALRSRAAAIGALRSDEVVAYCGSGVTACFDLLALETLGVRGRLYPGSWSAWAADPERAVATGD
jgi:thiosulfate/3-mercaptopyruvate sulfurtransferase